MVEKCALFIKGKLVGHEHTDRFYLLVIMNAGQAGGGIACGLCFGILLFFSSIYLLFLNEGWAITTQRSLDEALETVQVLDFREVEGRAI